MSEKATIIPFTKRETAILLALANAVLGEPTLHKYFNLDRIDKKGEVELEKVRIKLEDYLE